MSKYYFEYVRKMKIWLYRCPNIILGLFVKGKAHFRCDQIWLWICLSKKKLTLDMSKYDFEYVCQRKSLTLNMSKYDLKYVC
jgi:hypothetical protein